MSIDEDDIIIEQVESDVIVELEDYVTFWSNILGNPSTNTSLVNYLNTLLATKQDLTYFVVATEADKENIEDKKTGTVAFVKATKNLYIYYSEDSTTEWIMLIRDLSNYYTKSETDDLLALKANIADVYSKIDADARFATITNLNAHINNDQNPHSVTKEQVGLGNVENLAPADMPISDATQAALNLKANQTALNTEAQTRASEDTAIRESIGEGNLYIKKNGTTIATFNANQKGDTTANVEISDPQWGDIKGTLANQTDLQTALDNKVTKNANITANTKAKITYDSKGLVTGGADLTESDIPTLHLSKISDVTASASEVNVLDGITATTTELNFVDGVTSNVQTQFNTINDKIKEIELFKFPNAIIFGNPTINQGQVSGFTTTSYLQFPFVVDVRNKNFEIDFCFTTSDDVTTKQSIMDSKFGLALGIENGRGFMSMSSNGTSWNIGTVTGEKLLQPNTTYYAKVTWNGTVYKTALSTDGTIFTDDMLVNSSLGLYPVTIYIGGGNATALGRTPTPFKGSINFNKCFVYVAGLLIWQGMDDAGLATRADVSLSNLDSEGQAKFDAKMDASVKYGADLSYSDSKLQLKDQDGNLLGSSVTIESSPAIDNTTITKNTAGQLQASSLVDLTATVTELNYVDGVTSNIQTQLDGKLAPSDVVNNTTTTTTDKPLSANMGKELQDQVNNLKNIGKFLAIWNCSTGLPLTDPVTMPYTYNTGDYYRVGVVATEGKNYKPNGAAYTGAASTTEETGTVEIGWVYYYDGTQWLAQSAGGGGKIQDVQINGTTIVESGTGVANIPLATNSTLGVVETDNTTIQATDGVIKATSLDGLTATVAELNVLDGITATTDELNVLDGITATTTELNYTDGVTANIQTQLDKKQNAFNTITPLSLGTDTVGEPHNYTISGTTAIPTYSDDWGSARSISTGTVSSVEYWQLTNTASSNPTTFNDLINPNTSYIEIPVNFSALIEKVDSGEETSASASLIIGGQTEAYSGNIWIMGNLADGEFTPIAYQRCDSSRWDTREFYLINGENVIETSTNYIRYEKIANDSSNYETYEGQVTPYGIYNNLYFTYNGTVVNLLADSGNNDMRYHFGANVKATQKALMKKINCVRYFIKDTSINANKYPVTTEVKYTGTDWTLADGVQTSYNMKLLYDNSTITVNSDNQLQASSLVGLTANIGELNILDGIAATTAELNVLSGMTATTAELNVLDGITATTIELNYTDGVTSNIQTQLNSKVASNTSITGATHSKITYDSKGLVTAGSDLALTDLGVTASSTELNYVDGVTSNVQTQLDSKTVVTLVDWD